MYFFSEKHRLGRILHQTVDEVCLTYDDMMIKLTSGTNILCSNRVEFERDSDRTLWFDHQWVNSSNVHEILGKKILGIRQDDLDELKLILDCGSKLVFQTKNQHLQQDSADEPNDHEFFDHEHTLMIDFSYRDYTEL